MRVHELAKELGMESKALMAEMTKLGEAPKSHMSQVDEIIVAKIRAGRPASAASAAVKTASAPVVAPAAVARPVPPAKVVAASGAKAEPSAVATMPPPAAKKAEPAAAKPVAPAPAPVAASVAPVREAAAPKVPEPYVAKIHFPITVGNLAEALRVRIPDLIKSLMGIGIFANVNQLLNEEIVSQIAGVLSVRFERLPDEEEMIREVSRTEDPSRMQFRPPIVTIMGHVDHGKTSLLDAIRKTEVAAGEKGFITQHIGAYGVDIPGKGHVTFLDTPGHEAFTAMRARGANLTDVVVLVVAADDGVMPQTVEAIDHAREAACPIVVAINKVDLPAANTAKVLGELQKINLKPEEWGGKTICIKVSAKTGQGIDQLLEMLLLESEILELKANPFVPASGTVVESHLSKGSGPIATVIVQAGTLRLADMVVCGSYMGRVRSLKNDLGKTLKEVKPAYAAEVSGLNGIPEAGETFVVVEDEKKARVITEKRILEKRERDMRGVNKHMSLEDLYHRISEGNFKELKLIIKADVQGSVEALAQSLERLGNDKCRVRVIHGGVGGINESDVMLAAASDAIILGFHVKADPKSQKLAENEGVDTRFYGIIYEAVEDVKKAMEGLLEPTMKEVFEGRAQIRKIFTSAKVGTIGGSFVLKGQVKRTNPVRLIRNQVVLFEGKLASLKRFKDDVREVATGYECGIALEGFNDLAEGDIVESYRIEKIAGKL
ncbi:MAG: translation initiation factor IF-2 [Candidatus Omnitrophota bacterium]|jgi:translation initiation factor IF-2